MASTCPFAGWRSSGLRATLVALLTLGLGLSMARAASTGLDDGRCLLRQGQVRLAAEQLADRHAATPAGLARAQTAAALGQAYLRLNQPNLAEPLLREAMAGLDTPRARATAALDLGHLLLARHQPQAADDAWLQALQLAPNDAELALAVELNRLRLQPVGQRLPRLQAAAAALAQLPPGPVRTRDTLNLAAQALAEGEAATQLALQQYSAGRDAALAAADDALAAEAYDGLAALYERQQRDDESLRLTERGLRHAQRLPAPELAIPLEWRAGRLAQRQGDTVRALAAYRRAVEHVQAVRSDMPVQYVDGRSSFRETLEPVYLGLTDLLLQQSARVQGDERSALLRQARDTVELIKQTELEDYLRDRCSLGAARSAAPFQPPPATAIYYPIILPDRLELLLETEQGITRTPVAVRGDDLRRQALNFVAALRAGSGYRAQAGKLYEWLIQPLVPQLDAQHIRTLVAVPDGVLRLVPLGALHDGQDFIIRRWALATVPGLTLTQSAPDSHRPLRALLAGLSEPGPVLDKLPPQLVNAVLDPEGSADGARSGAAMLSRSPAAVRDALRDALALPGVRREVEDLGRLLGGTELLDRRFTLAALKQQLAAGDQDLVHIASHGVFGDSADNTFIMTYDELLTLDGLQRLLTGPHPRSRPIELITLSACQTAEGDDRAPLGMSGTALKANARSALGTLWPVSDSAAQRLMVSFYRRLLENRVSGHGSKIDALRAAQLDLIADPAFRHPFYWAPFILVGDWQ
ncbi:MAG: CHAT domain-containing protein [Rubrivivax sp.]|nr:CHAT domain-containing protein [Rubrivivax sp.]